MKIYLAGPMRGIPEFNFPAFDNAAKILRAIGHEVFSPAERDRADGFDPKKDVALGIDHYMAIDLPEVCKADAVAVLPGWEQSQGANIEVAVGVEVGKKILYADSLQPVEATARIPLIKKVNEAKPGPAYLNCPPGVKAPATSEVRMTDKSGGQKGVKLERFDLIPSWALQELARVYGFGESKYPSTEKGPNWRRGYRWGYSFGAMMRHAWLFWLGEERDKESGLHHLAHAAWHCMTMMTFWREKVGTDDRFDKQYGVDHTN